MPSVVTFNGGNTITYTYAADGTKLRTAHKIGSTTITTDYCANVIYEGGTQKFLLTGEGYYSFADSEYRYYLKDHQGNNRVVINSAGIVKETNHYYPFGGVYANTGNVQRYKYNGKELDTKNGLNWYDYGARHYDPALGRFTTVDPMAEKYYSTSLYTYCGNSPMNRIDPDGKDWRVQTRYNEETKKMEYTITVNAALYNNSSNKNLNMEQLSTAITEQVTNAYSTSGKDFEVSMNFNLKTVDSVDDIGERDHVIEVVDQDKLSKTANSVVAAESYMNSLDIKVGTMAVSNMLNNNDNRTVAHELGHTGGLQHEMNASNLMTQKRVIQDAPNGNYLKATHLNRSQIKAIRNNYINNNLNKHIPQWRQELKKR